MYDTCFNNINNPEKTDEVNKHLGGSSLFTLDVDSNKTRELVIGGSSFDNLLLLINSDASSDLTESSITAQQSNFPANYTNTIPLKFDHFLAGYYLDINNDGVKDLISSTNAESICSNSKNVWSYLNSNTSDKPDFNFLTSMGVRIGTDVNRTPFHNSETMETNVPGIFFAGVICGGLKTNKWFIENSREHAELIIKKLIS